MTIGIYSLYWEETDQIYIGQSEDIERRWKTHLYQLSNSTHNNYNLQNTYNKYGIPVFSILEVCERAQLLIQEKAWASEFDNLLNIQEPGTIAGSGLHNSNSRLSRIAVLKVFVLLCNTTLSMQQISTKLRIPRSTIEHIRYGSTHKWLQEEFSVKFSKMLQHRELVKFDSKNVRDTLLKVVSPNNTVFIVANLSRFARENNPFPYKWESFNRGLVRCMSDPTYVYKGWRIE